MHLATTESASPGQGITAPNEMSTSPHPARNSRHRPTELAPNSDMVDPRWLIAWCLDPYRHVLVMGRASIHMLPDRDATSEIASSTPGATAHAQLPITSTFARPCGGNSQLNCMRPISVHIEFVNPGCRILVTPIVAQTHARPCTQLKKLQHVSPAPQRTHALVHPLTSQPCCRR